MQKHSYRIGNKIFFMWFRHWRSGRVVRRSNGRPFCITI